MWLGGTTLSGMPRARVRVLIIYLYDRRLTRGLDYARVEMVHTGKRLRVPLRDLHLTSM